MAHTLISMPVWNCLFLMSHTPWTGVAIALFCKYKVLQRVESNRNSLAAGPPDQQRLLKYLATTGVLFPSLQQPTHMCRMVEPDWRVAS